jgi:hypothetical protein
LTKYVIFDSQRSHNQACLNGQTVFSNHLSCVVCLSAPLLEIVHCLGFCLRLSIAWDFFWKQTRTP